MGLGVSYKVNVPEETATSGSGPIFFQIQGPAHLKWLALGQGYQMTDGNLFVVYADNADNVTLSPRKAPGHYQPVYDPEIQAYLLEGSGIGDGLMTANIRCDNCLHLRDGQDIMGSSSNWMWAVTHGEALNTADPEVTLYQHDRHGMFTLDMALAMGGHSENPFGAKDEQYFHIDFTPFSTTQQMSDTLLHRKRIAHGVMTSVAFVLLFPNFGIILHLWPSRWTVPYIHAPLQIFSVFLALAGFGMGISVAHDLQEDAGYHPVIGYFAVAGVALIQPVLGVMQHIQWRRFKRTTYWGVSHRWFGRLISILGIINGGIGFHYAYAKNPDIPLASPISYAFICAGVVVIWVSAVWWRKAKDRAALEIEKKALAKEAEQVVYAMSSDGASTVTLFVDESDLMLETKDASATPPLPLTHHG